MPNVSAIAQCTVACSRLTSVSRGTDAPETSVQWTRVGACAYRLGEQRTPASAPYWACGEHPRARCPRRVAQPEHPLRLTKSWRQDYGRKKIIGVEAGRFPPHHHLGFYGSGRGGC